MPVYDCTFVISSQLDETAVEGHVQKAKELVERYGGKVVSEQRLGLRRLAYEVRKCTQGHYVGLVFEGGGETVKELERHFRLDEAFLRYLTCSHQEFPQLEEKMFQRPSYSGGFRERHYDDGHSEGRRRSSWENRGDREDGEE